LYKLSSRLKDEAVDQLVFLCIWQCIFLSSLLMSEF